jgi:hypothetical protein
MVAWVEDSSSRAQVIVRQAAAVLAVCLEQEGVILPRDRDDSCPTARCCSSSLRQPLRKGVQMIFSLFELFTAVIVMTSGVLIYEFLIRSGMLQFFRLTPPDVDRLLAEANQIRASAAEASRQAELKANQILDKVYKLRSATREPS